MWLKDGRPLNINGVDIRMMPGVGTIVLIMEQTVELHEGVYQCFASNVFGTAVSNRTILERAGLSASVT